MRINRSMSGALVGVAILMAGAHVMAQAYPTKPVHIIVPFPAGGGNDVTARLLGAKLSEALGQQFLVENRSGAGGSIGIQAVAKANPDGYTLMVVPQNLVINPSLLDRAGFDPLKDFAPIAVLVDSPVMIGVHASVPATNLKELIAHAKAAAGKLNYTSCGTGSPQHLAGEVMKSLTGVAMQHIPYGGCAPAVADAAAGRVEVLFATISHIVPHHKAGRMRGLATTGLTRSTLAPEFPTAIEAGVPNFDFNVWFGLLTPAKTPREIVLKLNAEVNKALADPAIKAQFEKLNLVPRGGTPEEFAKIIDEELARFAKLIRDVGIKPDLAGK
jgi:tripartite-type tricarboxylate transporter receptor subunit TctC